MEPCKQAGFLHQCKHPPSMHGALPSPWPSKENADGGTQTSSRGCRRGRSWKDACFKLDCDEHMSVEIRLCQHTAVSLKLSVLAAPSLPKIALSESRDSSHPTPSRRRQEQLPARTVLSASSGRREGCGVLNCCQCPLLRQPKGCCQRKRPALDSESCLPWPDTHLLL